MSMICVYDLSPFSWISPALNAGPVLPWGWTGGRLLLGCWGPSTFATFLSKYTAENIQAIDSIKRVQSSKVWITAVSIASARSVEPVHTTCTNDDSGGLQKHRESWLSDIFPNILLVSRLNRRCWPHLTSDSTYVWIDKRVKMIYMYISRLICDNLRKIEVLQ